jgi:Fic family protein
MFKDLDTKTGKIIPKWREMRIQVLEAFDKHPAETSVEDIESIFSTDAYNSLSIEGYGVTEELIGTVASDDWSDVQTDNDELRKLSLVARGYYLAFQKVKDSIVWIKTRGCSSSQIIESEFMDWYVEMWRPFVEAGIIRMSDIVGYRNRPVYIRNSWHVPPASCKILDYMDEYFTCLKNEESAAVRAILGHFFLTWIHPFIDGNGRMARFVMNAMLTTGGYSWTVVPVTVRKQYMAALEKASIDGDITEFTKLISNI